MCIRDSIHIAVIYVRCNIGKQLAADLIGFAVEDDDVHLSLIHIS